MEIIKHTLFGLEGFEMEENMDKTDKMQDGVAELKKIAKEQPPRRKSLLTPKERSVVFGVFYAILMALLTLSMDFIPVPEKDSSLLIMMVVLYTIMITVSIFIEWQLKLRFQIHRTLFYCVGQGTLLIAIIVLIVIGLNDPTKQYETSRELSYAMAFSFTEIILLLYHLVRKVIFVIKKAGEERAASARKKR